MGAVAVPVAPAAPSQEEKVGTDFETVVILDAELSAQLIKERQERGIDQHDEVWEGVYMMSPYADDEHQGLIHRFELAFGLVLTFSGRAEVRPGVNVSDREEDWDHNFRVPDVAIYLKDTGAKCFGPFWKGGPDFGVEIVSKNDKTRDKLEFYAKVGVRELLIVDRFPWQLELFRLHDGKLVSFGVANADDKSTLASNVIPFTFRLEPGDPRPAIVVGHTESEQTWRV